MDEMKARGISLPWGSDTDVPADAEAAPTESTAPGEPAEEESFGVSEAEITTVVEVGDWAAAKRAAMACHRTQLQDFGWLLGLPDDLAPRILSPEHFVLTRWPERGIPSDLHEESLFEGLEGR